jgi:hypothetical protein
MLNRGGRCFVYALSRHHSPMCRPTLPPPQPVIPPSDVGLATSYYICFFYLATSLEMRIAAAWSL